MRVLPKTINSKALAVLTMFMLLVAGFSAAAFAEDNKSIEESGSSDVQADQPINLSLIDLRNLFISVSNNVDSLQDSIMSMSSSVDAHDKSLGNIQDSPSGMKDQRKGSYYEFAYPNFVSSENLAAQLETTENQKDILEATLSFSADQLLSNYYLSGKQVKLYDQMIEKTEKTYAAIEDKFELGSISEKDLESSQIELENLKYNRDKLFYSWENIKYSILSTAELDPEKTYTFQEPIFTDVDFSLDNLSQYYESALLVSRDVFAADRGMEALLNEQKYVTLYHSSILKSDLLDFDRRLEEGKQAQEEARSEVYTSLSDYLNQFNHLVGEIVVADNQIKYDENYLDKLTLMESLGQVIDTDRQSYEIKVFESQIKKMNLEHQKLLLGQKLELLISSGIKL